MPPLPPPTPGVQTGQAIAQLVASTLTAHKGATQGVDAQTAVLSSRELSTFIHGQLSPAFEQVLGRIADDEELPPEIRALLSPVAHSIADIAGHILSQALSQLIGFGLAPLLTPFATELGQKIWSTIPIAALSPADAANMVVQGVLTEGEGAAEASQSGIDSGRFDKLVRIVGLPPGPQELQAAYNRGLISGDEFITGIKEGHTKDKYIQLYNQLREAILSPEAVAQMVVQNILSPDQGKAAAALSGVPADDFERMVAVRGRPISPTEATTLARRGQLDRAKFGQVVAESDVKTKYTDDLWNLRVRIPTLPQIRSMVAHGTISDSLANQLLADEGYEPEVAAALMASAKTTKTQKTRDLAQGQLEVLYEASYIDRATTESMLGQLGYDKNEVQLILDTIDARREKTFLDRYIGVVHAKYVNHLVDRNATSSRLDNLGLPSKARDDLIEIWTQERSANVRLLTPAQIESAVADGYIDYQSGLTKLVELGYSNDDATILLALKLHKTPKKPEAPGPIGAPA